MAEEQKFLFVKPFALSAMVLFCCWAQGKALNCSTVAQIVQISDLNTSTVGFLSPSIERLAVDRAQIDTPPCRQKKLTCPANSYHRLQEASANGDEAFVITTRLPSEKSGSSCLRVVHRLREPYLRNPTFSQTNCDSLLVMNVSIPDFEGPVYVTTDQARRILHWVKARR